MRFRSKRSGDGKLGLSLAVLILVVALAGACSGVSGQLQPDTGAIGSRYTVVGGMPCVVFDGGSISCDWTQWNGRVEDGVIVFPEVGR